MKKVPYILLPFLITGCILTNINGPVGSGNTATAKVGATVNANTQVEANVASKNHVEGNVGSKNEATIDTDVNAIANSNSSGSSSITSGSGTASSISPSPATSGASTIVSVTPTLTSSPTPTASPSGLQFESYKVSSEPFGNNNGKVERGEVMDALVLKLKNTSSQKIQLKKVTCLLRDPVDSQIKVVMPLALHNYYAVEPGEAAYMTDSMAVTIGNSCPPGHVITFDLTLEAIDGQTWTDSFSIQIP